MFPRAQPQRFRTRPGPVRSTPPPNVMQRSVIPYDYAASFPLRGIPGNIVQDVINIGVDGVFVVTAIGYGFDEERARDAQVRFPATTPSFIPGDVTLGQVPPGVLLSGFRTNPGLSFQQMLFDGQGIGTGPVIGARGGLQLSNRPLPKGIGDLFQQVKPQEEISFLFSLIDSGTGRELQDEPIHNLASLGKSNGERPFRVLPKPLAFQPRSTIRLQIIERTEGIIGTLFIVLYGYKLLGATGCPERIVRALRDIPGCPTETFGLPSERIIPFDYVATLPLSGQPGHIVEDEVPINVEGGFINTAIGYGLAVEDHAVAFIEIAKRLQPPLNSLVASKNARLDLNELPLKTFPPDALNDGIRIRPSMVRIAMQDGGALTTQLRVELADEVFERLNRPEDVSFRYSIFDTGTGRELQNRPIHNIAGLGIANGDRPFKTFARPMLFLPRSSIRVTVEERFGRGRLFIVFQGYKLLGMAPAGRPS